ncbi:MAG: preprotein translocase subunit YajC [Clostridiales bacterium]|jgi:preprotein translocase subunit YajC|nr:preprotein translocase subunit YajC [Clostridiales bacterium]
MLSDFFTLLIDVSTTVTKDGAAAVAATAGEVAAATGEAAAPASGGLNPIIMIAVWAAVIGLFYFFSIRPQSKKEKQLKELQSSIKAGDNVITTSGFYGKVMDVGEDCFIIEFGTNRGVRIPVRKSDIVGIKTPNINSNAVRTAESH